MNSFKTYQKSFLGLAFCLIYPSIAIFKKIGYLPLVLYVVFAICLLLLFLWTASRLQKSFTRSTCITIFIFLFLLLIISYLVIHPQIDTDGFNIAGVNVGASDGDDAIDIAITELMQGRYPYYAKTFHDNPLSPMPGALLLAFPFYIIGQSGLQNIFWLMIFFTIIAYQYRSIAISTLLAIIVFCLSPNVIYHLLQAGDYIANSLYIFTFCTFLLSSIRRRLSFWQSILWAVLLGVGLSSRLNYIVILPLVFWALHKLGSPKTAWILLLVILVSFSGITLPFIIYDPSGFSPLHTSNKLSIRGIFPWAPFLLPALAGGLAIILGWRSRIYTLSNFMRDVMVVQAVLILGGLFLGSLNAGRLNFAYFHFGVLFMFFGVYAFGPNTLIDSGAVKPKKTLENY
jgi:hypothetical protein